MCVWLSQLMGWVMVNVALIIALFGLLISISTIRNTNNVQKTVLLNELIGRESELRKLLKSATKKELEIFYNFMEYFAFLINTKKLDKKSAKLLLEQEFYTVETRVSKDYKKEIKKDPKVFENLLKLVAHWRKEK